MEKYSDGLVALAKKTNKRLFRFEVCHPGSKNWEQRVTMAITEDQYGEFYRWWLSTLEKKQATA